MTFRPAVFRSMVAIRHAAKRLQSVGSRPCSCVSLYHDGRRAQQLEQQAVSLDVPTHQLDLRERRVDVRASALLLRETALDDPEDPGERWVRRGLLHVSGTPRLSCGRRTTVAYRSRALQGRRDSPHPENRRLSAAPRRHSPAVTRSVNDAPDPDSDEFPQEQNTVDELSPPDTSADAPATDPEVIDTDPTSTD